MGSQLAFYTELAKTLDSYILINAIRDIKATLELWKDAPENDPYVAKLLAEFDAYTVELYTRRGLI